MPSESDARVDPRALAKAQTIFHDDREIRARAHDCERVDDGDSEEGGHVKCNGSK